MMRDDGFSWGENSAYIANVYQAYLNDPNSASPEWKEFFSELPVQAVEFLKSEHIKTASVDSVDSTIDSMKALMLIHAYRTHGHLLAKLDPLNLKKQPYHPELDPKTYGFQKSDYKRLIYINSQFGLTHAKLEEILGKLESVYCQSLGIEFIHIQDPEKRLWIQNRSEHRRIETDQRRILHDLIRAEAFEKFLHTKYPSAKRFGLEGGESLIPALETILSIASQFGATKVFLGMAHRGRLSVMANIIGRPVRDIVAHFHENYAGTAHGSGDVKYHLGYSSDRQVNNKSMHVSLASNPSHLEAVNSVVLGNVRGEQTLHGKDTTLGVLMHGDAAFSGQGVVAETLELSNLDGYKTGGTIHIIINNQIGFTTSPSEARTSLYSSDIAKAIQAPIIHVNGDDPEAVVWAAQLATDFRYKFKQDIVIDLVCYRRHGHNEIDEPSFTQPLMYQTIATHPSTRTIFEKKLIEANVVTKQEVEKFDKKILEHFQSEFEASLIPKDSNVIARNSQNNFQPKTGIESKFLQEIGIKVFDTPETFNLHPKLKNQFETKRQKIKNGEAINWVSAEALAIASLLLEGKPVRLSGQDSSRGTFSQRHATVSDIKTDEKYTPLNNIRPAQTQFEMIDSPLSEAAVLGFEYGYTLANPHALVMWEAQFGDFGNGAQIIIDQFIAAAETKWLQSSNLVMLLPHGFEGQGSEHSSARLERYLQLCAEDNMRVINCSTPANYFHALRRQIHSAARVPLIVMTPKSLLRHKLAVSSLADMGPDTQFRAVIKDETVNADTVKRVILCSGKVYYDLYQKRQELGLTEIALIRLEQFYPFPEQELIEALSPFKNAEFIWCQEEPMNMGAWTFLDRRIEAVLIKIGASQSRPIYIGRPAAAAPATGIHSRHIIEQEKLISEALKNMPK